MNNKLSKLPVSYDIETKAVLRKLSEAHRALAELKGLVKSIPNESILINTLALQEARDSSAIENIVTTIDDLYRDEVYPDRVNQLAAKEVRFYGSALQLGFSLVKENGLLLNKHILAIQQELERNRAGFRCVPGTVLRSGESGEIVYTPPQEHVQIIELMTNLENYINDDSLQNIDPLLKMAIIHYQFESIHPFYDGNGRTGRIINILYLVLKKLLDFPVLYLSRYIVVNKTDYYRLLQAVRTDDQWETWALFMLTGIEQTAKQSMYIVEQIKILMSDFKCRLKTTYSFYSHELLNNLFLHPYTKVEFLQADLGVSRATASRYLDLLSKDGLLSKHTLGKAHFFVNTGLYSLLQGAPKLPMVEREQHD